MSATDMSDTDMSDTMTTGLTSDRLRKVRALLAKAEQTDFPDEADTYLGKAAMLIAKWELDEAMVWEHTPSDRRAAPITAMVGIPAPYAGRKSVLLGVVGEANGCRVIRVGHSSEGHRFAVIGFAHDVEVTELLFSSLLVQMTRAMLAERPPGSNGTATAQWRRSFIVAFSNRVGARLTVAREVAGAAQQQSAAGGERPMTLVLADRSRLVDDETRQQFPRLRSSYVSAGSSAARARAGAVAGNRAELGDHLKPGPKALVGR